ncbi:MAG: hypothetical protein WCJ36_02570 [Candidatus Saccharibacteria bacterium]
MKTNYTEATTIRVILATVAFLTTVTIIGGFYFTQNYLKDFANQPNTSSQSVNSAISSQSLTKLQNDISTYKVSNDKANAITLSSRDFPTKITNDLNKYATSTGIDITYAVAETPTSNLKNLAPISNIQPKFISVTFNRSMPFTNFIKFLKAIETNLPKMQPTNITISRDPSSGNLVKVDPIILEVYIK